MTTPNELTALTDKPKQSLLILTKYPWDCYQTFHKYTNMLLTDKLNNASFLEKLDHIHAKNLMCEQSLGVICHLEENYSTVLYSGRQIPHEF